MVYWQTYRAWLLALIKERLYLSSKWYRPDLKKSAWELRTLINANGYRNNRTLAGFLIRKSEQIEQLIPKNKAYETQILTLRMATEEGKVFLPPES